VVAFVSSIVSAQPAEKFEVASVRLSKAVETLKPSWSDPGELTFNATNIPLKILISMAYKVEEKQVANLNLCGNAQYDIFAKPGYGVLTPERLEQMLRGLLEERFGVVSHRETRMISGFALVTAKSRPRLHASDASVAGRAAVLRGRIIGRGTDMAVLASMLGQVLRVPVLDETGVKGGYDIDFKFAPEDSLDSSSPSLFTAIQEDLGLRLESKKMPVDMLVIDHCQREPTEN